MYSYVPTDGSTIHVYIEVTVFGKHSCLCRCVCVLVIHLGNCCPLKLRCQCERKVGCCIRFH